MNIAMNLEYRPGTDQTEDWFCLSVGRIKLFENYAHYLTVQQKLLCAEVIRAQSDDLAARAKRMGAGESA